MSTVIATEALTKRYKKNVALDTVSLSVPRGSCFGLLGPNGAGKSTLVKTLLGIVRPTSGAAQLLGRDITDKESRRGVGYLPEGHQFPKYLSGRGVCRYFGKLAGIHGRELEAEVAEKLELVGMTDRADDRITKYSKGMKQRVGLAQAMLGQPEVIFLDEPTDGVDPVGRKDIRDVIGRITEQGVTVFLNSHLLSEVELICDQLAILNEGKVLAEGTVAEIKSKIGVAEGVQVKVRTGSRPDGLWASLSAQGATSLDDDWFQIGLPDIEDVSPLIDEIRGAGVSIHAVQPREATLEDAFVSLIEGADGAREASDA